METATRVIERQAGALSIVPTPGAEPARTLTATASFLLSERGRKASLLSGGDGRSLQQLTVQVPEHRLHLVSVDRKGAARLKLRPRYERDGARIVRIDTAPVYDAPPSLDELYRAAAQNHELEAAFDAQHSSFKNQRADAERARRQSVAEAFFTDKTMRAAVHPPPTPKTCYVPTAHGGIAFDVAIDQGLAKDVPAEAHRRFRADLRARQDQVRQEQIAQAALHQEKKQFIDGWVREYGTPDEQARHAAGVLPMAEVIRRISDDAFAPINTRPVYVRDGAQRLQSAIRQHTGSSDIVVSPADVVIQSTHAVVATAEQWAAIREIQERLPDAHAVLRHHLLMSRRHQGVPSLVIIGVLVNLKLGPFLLRREYIVSDHQQAAPAQEVDRH